jgi:hypothetical protein
MHMKTGDLSPARKQNIRDLSPTSKQNTGDLSPKSGT